MAQVETREIKKIEAVPARKHNFEFDRKKDKEPVKGKFHNHEVPGGSLSFSYLKYKGDKLENYTLIDGEIYTLPLGVAKHLNNNCWYPAYAHLSGSEAGVITGLSSELYGASGQHMKISQKVRRFSFQSLEFVDIEDLNPVNSLITAEIV